MPIEKETEDLIYAAARQVFQEKGFDGARMQEIADRAGINKALLHYYFRSKDRLFEMVFQAAVSQIFPKVMGPLMVQAPLRERVEHFVTVYIDTLRANPFLPGFVLHELSRNPERIKAFIPTLVRPVLKPLFEGVHAAMADGDLPPINPAQFIMNLVSLCIFPFVARPIFQAVLGFDDEAYGRFLEERKKIIPAVLFGGASPSPF